MLDLPPVPYGEPLVSRLEGSWWGCRYLIYCLGGVRQGVEREGELTETAVADFRKWLREQAGELGKKLEQLRAWRADNPEGLEPEALRTRHQDEVLKYLKGRTAGLEYLLARHERRADAHERARRSASVLPSEAALDKILRYETALDRQLFRAMNQLERLQRRRQGEHVPAPLAVDISAKA